MKTIYQKYFQTLNFCKNCNAESLFTSHRDFLFAGEGQSVQLCAKQQVINENDGTQIAYSVCPSHNATGKICKKKHLPFDAWYSNVSIYKSCCGTNASASSMQTNLTLVNGCDPVWQDPPGIKFNFCNHSHKKSRPRQINNGIIEPPSLQVIMAVLSLTGNSVVLI